MQKVKVVIPWKQILLSVPVWSIVLTNIFFFGATKGVIVNLPLFIKDVLNATVTEVYNT